MTDIQHLRELIREGRYYLYHANWPRVEFYKQHGRWCTRHDWTLARMQEEEQPKCAMTS